MQYAEWIYRTGRLYAKTLAPVCRRFSLTRAELDVLLFLTNNPGRDTAAQIVKYRGLSKSHVSLAVSSLTERGLLRGEFREDKRSVHLLPTPESGEAAAAGRRAQNEFYRLLFSGLSEEERRLFFALNDKIMKNLEEISR